MKPDLLVLKPLYAATMAELERNFTVNKVWTAPDRGAFFSQIGEKVRAAVTTTTIGFSRRDFEAFPNLEILANWGPYVPLIDLAAAKERGVPVTYTPDSTAKPVADLAMGMVVAVMRRLFEADRFVRAGKWPTAALPPGTEVHGKTCGIVGLGGIGREVAVRATGFGMSVCYFGPRRKDDVTYPYFDDLEAMARASDCLIVTCALMPATRNLIDARILGALGAGGFLVNVARGAIVNQQDLVTALSSGQIAGAALDVFWDEPRIPPELMQMDNVLLSPHIGTSTLEVRERRSNMLLADLRAFLAGDALIHPVMGNKP